jgi:hypothetical protein
MQNDAGVENGTTDTKQNIRSVANIRITSPQQGTFVPNSQLLIVSSSVSDSSTVESIVYIVNGTPVATATVPPYTASILPTVRGMVTLTAFARYKNGTTDSHSISITIQ